MGSKDGAVAHNSSSKLLPKCKKATPQKANATKQAPQHGALLPGIAVAAGGGVVSAGKHPCPKCLSTEQEWHKMRACVFSFLIEKGLLHNRIKGKAERQAAASRVPPARVVGHVARQAGLPTPCPQWWISAFREDNLPWHA